MAAANLNGASWESLVVRTIRDLALCPPYVAAKEILDEVANDRPTTVEETLADVSARQLVQQACSVPAGLIEIAEQLKARFIVLGSSTSGLFGRITLGSATGRLLHGSPFAVMMAPRGFRREPETRITRVSAAYGGPDPPRGFLIAAAAMAADLGASLRW